MGVVYLATNTTNGMMYVGSTIGSLDERRKQHLALARKGALSPFHAAIREYGPEVFVWRSLRESTEREVLLTEERRCIRIFDTYGADGYNSSSNGMGNGNPRAVSDSTKRKISQSVADRQSSWQLRDKRLQRTKEEVSLLGVVQIPELTLEAIRAARKVWLRH